MKGYSCTPDYFSKASVHSPFSSTAISFCPPSCTACVGCRPGASFVTQQLRALQRLPWLTQNPGDNEQIHLKEAGRLLPWRLKEIQDSWMNKNLVGMTGLVTEADPIPIWWADNRWNRCTFMPSWKWRMRTQMCCFMSQLTDKNHLQKSTSWLHNPLSCT